MALTLTQGNLYSTTELDKILNDYLVKDSRILQLLPFETVLGNSLTYDIVATRSGVKFYQPNETWVESTLVIGHDTAALKIMGGDADLDEFIRRTRSNKMDIQRTVVEEKVLALQEFFLDCFYYGTAKDATSWNGLQQLISQATSTHVAYNTVHAGSSTTGSALSLDKLQQAIDLIKGFTPKIIMMSKRMRRGISYYLDGVGDKFSVGRDEFGNPIEKFRNIEIGVSDHIVDTELTASAAFSSLAGTSTTTIFILSFGPKAICGIQGTNGIETKPLGDLETKDAQRHRIKWYNSLMLQNLRSVAKVDGIASPQGTDNVVTQ